MNKQGSMCSSVLHVFLGCAAVLLACSCTSNASDDVPYAKPDNLQECVDYINTHYMTPEDYVIEKFKTHNVVIIGEYHRVKHDVMLVQNLIPLLYANGIYTVAIEFASYEDQALIDRLITAADYDEQLARTISLHRLGSLGLGGYQEYCDIFKAAWKLNKTLTADARKMRVLGVNDTLDWSPVKKEADRDNPEIRRKVFKNWSEQHWAERVKTEVLDKNEKVLCYCGMHHAFSKYRQPVADKGKFIRFGDVRFGNYLYEIAKGTVFTISLHHPWVSIKGYEAPAVLPVDGAIDVMLAALPADKRRFGFDTVGSPLGSLKAETSLYSCGYDRFTLSTFCDGYICQCPFTEYEGVTPIDNFIHEGNIGYVREQGGYPFNTLSAAEINERNAAVALYLKDTLLKSCIQAVKKIRK